MQTTAPSSPATGLLIAIEGIDGCGKSSLAQALAQRLAATHPTILTKQPGGTALGTQLRALVLNPSAAVSPRAEYLMFAADRAQHFHEVVLPALAQGMIVISDRMGDSSLAYQGYARGLDQHIIRMVNAWAMHNRTPDIILYLRINPAIAFERMARRNEALTAFECEKKEFMQTASDGFDAIFNDNHRVAILDAELTPETLVNQAYARIIGHLHDQSPAS